MAASGQVAPQSTVLEGAPALVTIVQACAIAHVCRRTLYNWMEAGRVEYVRTPTGRRRIFVDSLLHPVWDD